MNDEATFQQRKAAKRRQIHDGELTFGEQTAAKKIGVSHQSIERYRKQGLISFFRVGSRILYDDSCLQEFLQKHRRNVA